MTFLVRAFFFTAIYRIAIEHMRPLQRRLLPKTNLPIINTMAQFNSNAYISWFILLLHHAQTGTISPFGMTAHASTSTQIRFNARNWYLNRIILCHHQTIRECVCESGRDINTPNHCDIVASRQQNHPYLHNASRCFVSK